MNSPPLAMPLRPVISRRLLLRLAAVQGATSALAACGGATADLAVGASAAGGGSAARFEVDAITNRKPVDGASAAPWFGSDRSGAVRAVEVKFAPPPSGLFGRASASLTGRWQITSVEPNGSSDPIAGVAQRAVGREVLLYIHGYNESFESAVISAAELSTGIRFKGMTAAFCWPSKSGLLDYVYDRESALWSRDALQDLLEALVRNGAVGRVHIVAHSMGSLLLLETLRQLWASSASADIPSRFGAIVLAAPDVDIDQFAATLKRIGPLAQHITVITSSSDRALGVSRRIAGGVARVGGADRSVLEPLGVKVVDASDYGWGVIGHDVFLTNTDVRQVITRAIERQGAVASR
ncbi:alpha/beta hydrolase [Chelatococcus asaccharovorans]|uniref:alpha/beta hydrolase n=1 Tax=Chelatococcus asaccharovorans TaxID=28210 RepID=UPI00224C7055|nr:alpha/beta hydrolase [Chelatococcus asaccharovorans]CAH1670871.1 Esterase/lipase superfamily enzyme [Chelatococcus asaccharovorans]CAH1677682.1 Esterase/lipase superfamily enzyme [Chelatococcus asaccharovorans]